MAAIGAAAACGQGASDMFLPYHPPVEVADASSGGVDEGVNGSGVGAGTGAPTGLPCDVQQRLENRCFACHLAGTPYPLLSYEGAQVLLDGSHSLPPQSAGLRQPTHLPGPRSHRGVAAEQWVSLVHPTHWPVASQIGWSSSWQVRVAEH
jgi:hypothetical protein